MDKEMAALECAAMAAHFFKVKEEKTIHSWFLTQKGNK